MDRSVPKHSKSVALVRLSGPKGNGEEAKFIPLEKTKYVIGASITCDLSFSNLSKLSRNHAMIYVEKGTSTEENWWIVDMKSRCGTFVMNARIGAGFNNRIKLTHGCRIALGTELTFVFVDNYISRLIGSPKNKVFANQTCQTELPPSSLLTELSAVLSEMNCPLCYEYLISPQVLNCSHTFCQWCLAKWNLEYKKSHPFTSTCCPMCRVNIQTTTAQLTLENMIALLLERVLDKATFEEWKKLIPVRKELLEKMKSEGTRNESESLGTNRFIFRRFGDFAEISRIREFIEQIGRVTGLSEIDDEVIDLSDSDDEDNEVLMNASLAVHPNQIFPRPLTPQPVQNPVADNFFLETLPFLLSLSEDEETPANRGSRNHTQEQPSQFRFRSIIPYRRPQPLQQNTAQNQPEPNPIVQPTRAPQRSSSQPFATTALPSRGGFNRGNISSNNRASNIPIANRRTASNEQRGEQVRAMRTQRNHPYHRASNRRA